MLQHPIMDLICVAGTLAILSADRWSIRMFNFFRSSSQSPVEKWANHNARKATPDDLIAGAIVSSFAKDFKHWKFEGEFNQRHSYSESFIPTSLSRKMVGKKHINIVFVFRQTTRVDAYSSIYAYKVMGCEVNGIRVTHEAFRHIFLNWNKIVVQVKRAEQVAAEAEERMKANETKWDLAESLLGMRRDGFGRLMPVKTAEEGETA